MENCRFAAEERHRARGSAAKSAAVSGTPPQSPPPPPPPCIDLLTLGWPVFVAQLALAALKERWIAARRFKGGLGPVINGPLQPDQRGGMQGAG